VNDLFLHFFIYNVIKRLSLQDEVLSFLARPVSSSTRSSNALTISGQPEINSSSVSSTGSVAKVCYIN
jgi:hypothetical protein